MAQLQIFEPASQFIDGKLDGFLNQGVSNVIAEVAGPMRAALVLYVILYGFAILRGSISEPIIDFAIRSLKLSVIYMLATTVAYSSWITTPLFHTLPDALTAAVSGASSPDVGLAFDNFFGRGCYLADKIAKTASMTDLMPLLISGVVYVIAALAAAIGFGIVIVAKVALALIVCLGPAFVACALFEATRRFFFGWLGQALNYVILMALIVTVFQLILSLVGDQWSSIDGADPTAGGLIFIALSILGAIFFLQTPVIAAGLVGGASAGIGDFANAMSGSLRTSAQTPSQNSTKGGGGSMQPVGAKR